MGKGEAGLCVLALPPRVPFLSLCGCSLSLFSVSFLLSQPLSLSRSTPMILSPGHNPSSSDSPRPGLTLSVYSACLFSPLLHIHTALPAPAPPPPHIRAKEGQRITSTALKWRPKGIPSNQKGNFKTALQKCTALQKIPGGLAHSEALDVPPPARSHLFPLLVFTLRPHCSKAKA